MSARECRELQPMLSAYADGEFEPSERAEVDAHLALCPACRAHVHQQQALREGLRAAASVRAPEHLRAKVLADIKHERRWDMLRAVVRPEIVAAVAACAGLAAWFSSRYLLAPILDDAISHHTHNLPVEVTGDEEHVRSWLTGKVDFNVQLPRLQRVSIAGARLSHVRDHNAAYVVYQGPRAHRVSLFVFDDPHATIELGLGGRRTHVANRDVFLATERGYNVAMWHDDEIVYQLVSDLDEREIVDLLPQQRAVAAPAQADAPAPIPTLDVQHAALHAP